MLDAEKISKIINKYNSPMYIFDLDELEDRIKDIAQILGDDITLCYAMKANPFLVNKMKGLVTKFEVCSPGEFSICEREKVDMKSIVLSGVNKELTDINHVMDDCKGVGMYTVESLEQFSLLSNCADKRNIVIPVLLRLTSGNQFGMDEKDIDKLIQDRKEYPHIDIKGIQCYTGTQKKKISHIVQELEWLDGYCTHLNKDYGFITEELEYGPGLPVDYFGEAAYHNNYEMLEEFAKNIRPLTGKYKITLEMGRYLTALCGHFVSGIVDLKTNKDQNYCIIDGGINHINYYGQTMAMKIPAFTYIKKNGSAVSGEKLITDASDTQKEKWTVCGSLCTVGDVLVKNIPISEPEVGDILVFHNIGAYSVTEGIYLFLSRKMPLVTAWTDKEGIEVYRDSFASDIINSRQILVNYANVLD